MKRIAIIPSLLLTFGSLLISCEADVSTETEAEATTEISSSELSGFLNSEVFTPATIHYTKGKLFGDAGYEFKLFEDAEACEEGQSLGDITFFVESETALTVGEYDGEGPYFHYKDGDDSGSASFFGADVVIEAVTETTITGRVRGGDDAGNHFIDGAFVASLCQK